MGVIRKMPLPPGVVVAPVVTEAGEVDPLRVPELVTHEGEVALAAERHGHEADDLVHGDAAVHDRVRRRQQRHPVVHLLVHQPEGDGLVADKRLVVRLAVAHHLLLVAAVGEGVDDVAHVPLVVRAFLEQLDPHVGCCHRKPVVEAEASLVDGAAERGHARHVLGDRDGAGADGVDEVVGKHEIHACVHVRSKPKVLAVTVDEAVPDAVMLVEDGGHAVEAEAVEAVLLQPPPQVRQQETQHLPRRVVEDTTVPEGVVAFGPLVEVLMRGAVEVVDAVKDVLGSVRVHNVEQHRHPHRVRLVDQALQAVGVTTAGGGGEEVGDVVAEGGVVGVLLDRHELDGVVPEALDAREDVLAEVVVRVHVGVTVIARSGHADVGLVDAKGAGGDGELVLELELLRGVPKHRVVPRMRRRPLGSLDGVVGPCGDARSLLAGGGCHGDLVASVVADDGAVGAVGDEHCPHAVVVLLVGVLPTVPVVEVTEEAQPLRPGSPLAANDARVGGVVVVEDSELLVALSEVLERALHFDDARLELLVAPIAILEAPLAALKGRVPLDHLASVLSLPVLVWDLVPRHVLRGGQLLAGFLCADADRLVLPVLVVRVHHRGGIASTELEIGECLGRLRGACSALEAKRPCGEGRGGASIDRHHVARGEEARNRSNHNQCLSNCSGRMRHIVNGEA
mmetsp:Transcript_53980/g.110172  ORF Transcript_53980/g.110172 Transcript_53980/m.110172 type:complete len:679 (+) Transcript_53980:411-2447(+)